MNQRFVDELSRHPTLDHARVVDLGCGPADIPARLAAALPEAGGVAIDASVAMLALPGSVNEARAIVEAAAGDEDSIGSW